LPDLALDKRHIGSFAVGEIGTYRLVVRNVGTGPTTGAVTVRDTLPAGLSFASSSGTGWIFLSLGSVVSATNPDVIASCDSSWFTISVVIGAAALPSVTNSAWASVPGDPNRFNDRGSD